LYATSYDPLASLLIAPSIVLLANPEQRSTAMELSKRQRWLMTGAAALGIAVGAAGIAGAATNGSSSTSDSTATTVPAASENSGTGSGSGNGSGSMPDPRSVAHGPNETVLTGDTADKVTAAANAAVPGATVLRVETDSEGSPYEAHMQKSDGSIVTVKIDSNFNVTETIDGFGAGPGGPGGPGAPGGDQAQAPSYN
jgi:hypothetical protein